MTTESETYSADQLIRIREHAQQVRSELLETEVILDALQRERSDAELTAIATRKPNTKTDRLTEQMDSLESKRNELRRTLGLIEGRAEQLDRDLRLQEHESYQARLPARKQKVDEIEEQVRQLAIDALIIADNYRVIQKDAEDFNFRARHLQTEFGGDWPATPIWADIKVGDTTAAAIFRTLAYIPPAMLARPSRAPDGYNGARRKHKPLQDLSRQITMAGLELADD